MQAVVRLIELDEDVANDDISEFDDIMQTEAAEGSI